VINPLLSYHGFEDTFRNRRLALVIANPIQLQIPARPMLVSRDKVCSYDLSTPDHNPILLNLDVHSLHPPVIEP